MTRRAFLAAAASALPLRMPGQNGVGKVVRVAMIADLHHGLAPDAIARFDAFEAAVRQRGDLDLAVQMGDFCHPGAESGPLTAKWRDLPVPQLNVLGNHDMDRGTKETIMAQWGMPARFGAYDVGAFRFVVLDLNNLRRGQEVAPYANGNYFESGVTCDWADPEQLEWLERELRRGMKPTILLSHQPLGFGTPGGPLPEPQTRVLRVVLDARAANPAGAVVACLSGHLHVDRFEAHEGIPCLSVNSASYFWHEGMHPYRDPLFAFLELDPAGELRVIGRKGAFAKDPPKVATIGMSASISNRRVRLTRTRA
ncbi:MAG: metallophosphoesterase [Fimbriimonadaceae bacterium]|nr:metallophosphoesterase [Fimbriimonadaceae bacterium]